MEKGKLIYLEVWTLSSSSLIFYWLSTDVYGLLLFSIDEELLYYLQKFKTPHHLLTFKSISFFLR